MEELIEESYGRRPERLRRRKKKRGRTVAKLMINLTVGALIALAGIMIIYYNDPRHKLVGEWVGKVDVSDEVTKKASDWFLAAAMGNSVDLTEAMNGASVDTHLVFSADGTWSTAVDKESYDACLDLCYEGMAQGLRDFVRVRFGAASKPDMSDEQIDSLFSDTIGMSVKDYLKEFGPQIMPTYESMKAAYEREGVYTADKKAVTINNEITADYVVNGRLLALDGIQAGNSVILTRDGDISDRFLQLFASARDDEIPDLGKAYAATSKNRILENMTVHVSGGNTRQVKTIHYNYKNNRYVSLRDLALALKGSTAEYSVSVAANEINITKGKAYSAVGGEDVLFEIRKAGEPADNGGITDEAPVIEDEVTVTDADGEEAALGDVVPAEDPAKYIYVSNTLKLNKITVDGKEVKYFTITGNNPVGKPDAFMSITDIAMILDVDMQVAEDGLYVDPSAKFSVDINELKDAGFYTELRSALVGDASTSEIYASFCEDVGVSIASTTKLMNLLCVMDALASGQISRDDVVTATLEASLLSKTDDGVVPMEEGDLFTVNDLIYGMMLPSSNECALMLATHISGSEEAYVKLMNDKAMEMGLSDNTVFYNCHGLPVFSDNIATTKLQNQMTADDMFKLVSYMLAVYPQITDITSAREYQIASKDLKIKNLNPMLYNVPGTIGLKTGTTNMAGASLVSAVSVKDASDIEHIIVAIEFGAEDSSTRNAVSEMMLRYGINKVRQSRDTGEGASTVKLKSGDNMPTTAEALIRLLIKAS